MSWTARVQGSCDHIIRPYLSKAQAGKLKRQYGQQQLQLEN
jgi:hypothetical protein